MFRGTFNFKLKRPVSGAKTVQRYSQTDGHDLISPWLLCVSLIRCSSGVESLVSGIKVLFSKYRLKITHHLKKKKTAQKNILTLPF